MCGGGHDVAHVKRAVSLLGHHQPRDVGHVAATEKTTTKKGGAERITHIGSLSKTTTKNERITVSTQGQNAKRPALGDRRRFVRENAHKRGQEATRKAWTNWDRLGQAAEGNLSLPPKKVMIEKHTTAETVLSRPRKIAKKIYTGSSAPA